MRIAVYHNLPSGGGKRALCEHVRRLSVRHAVDVFTLSCAEHAFCDLRPFAGRHDVTPFSPSPLLRRPFGRLNQGIRALDLFRLRHVQRDIAERIDEQEYDVVLAANCQFGAAPMLLQFLRTPSVYYCQEPPRLAYEPGPARPYAEHTFGQKIGDVFDPFPALYVRTLRAQDRRSTMSAGMVLVNSHYSRETFYRTYGRFPYVGYLGVDLDTFRCLAPEKGDYVLSVGSLNARKGFDFLVQSLGLLPEAIRPRLVVVSNAAFEPERRYLIKLANQHDVELDLWQGISDQELVEFYNRALVTVYAPIMEPFGLVPIESMACGTPVVAVREAGIRETVQQGATGLLTEREPEEFSNALRALVVDRALLDRMGKTARAYVEKAWSWDQSVKGLEQHLARVAGQNSK